MVKEKIHYQEELLYNRLTKRYRHLKKWARRTGTNAFRLYDRDIPEIPLVLDLYGDAVSGAYFKKPPEREPRGEDENWLKAMKAAIAMALDIPENQIFLKERIRMRYRQEAGSQYGRIQNTHFYRDVSEKDLKFRVNLSDYLDTGLFLDARKKRALIRQEAAGKRLLNLFAYTATLSVSAAIGGARHVDSVDLSNTYLEWGKINFAMNGLEASGKFPFIRSDVLQYLVQAKEKGERWDIIILDSPSFSNSKKMKGSFDIKRDHKELIQLCLSLLSPGGKLFFSSNAKGFSLESGSFSGVTIVDIGKDLVDEDFLGKRMPMNYRFTID